MNLDGFSQPADAIVPCKACGAREGKPCRGRGLTPGQVHFGRRVARLLLTAGGTAVERARFELERVQLLRKATR